MSQPIAITAVGMVTGVGLSAPASCAAIRSAINNFQETHYMDDGGEWIKGCSVSLEEPLRGKAKLLKMAAAAIQECLEQKPQILAEETPLLLCLPETERPGRVFKDDDAFFMELQQELGLEFHAKSRVIAMGRVSIGVAIQRAQELIHHKAIRQVMIVGTDSLLVAGTLLEFQEREYLLTSQNSDGFIPAEASSAIVIEPVYKTGGPQLICYGIGFGIEPAPIDSEEPCRAEGLTTAIKQALENAKIEMHDLDFRITGLSGKQYDFKEASLALSRTLRARKESFDIWNPAECIGETGASIGGIMFGVAKASCEKKYSQGNNILIHVGNEDGKRAAIILSWQARREDK